ncbi:MAG: hypothetical protein HRU19_07875 [Pseudobacteriovorax sp.]|nr:hypothetical protein [Pseudobacteriovorax sp.]
MPKISGKTPKYGILGSPIAKSLSPAIHNHAISELGLDALYVPIPYDGEDINGLIEWLPKLGYAGINITVPFKEKVAAALPQIVLDSVNTLRFDADSQPKAISTDGKGFYRALERECHPGDFDQIIVLGSGGAVISILDYFYQKHPQIRTQVIRRSTRNDERIQKICCGNAKFKSFDPSSIPSALEDGKNALFIQGTSAPMHGNPLSDFANELDRLEGFLVDITYGYPSDLLKSGKSKGLKTQDGLPMLIEQARVSQEFWWNKSASYDEILRVLSNS